MSSPSKGSKTRTVERVVVVEPEEEPQSKWAIKRWLDKHHSKIWWLHSFYALGLGAFVAAFANKGFDTARWLVASLAGAWILAILLFRFFGSGKQQAIPDGKNKVKFYVMTYLLKNLYQGMLFFLLPFYWKSTTIDSPNRWFVLVLGLCAFLSTMDVVFDKLLMKFRALASVFYAITLFAAVNLVVPALFPNIPALVGVLVSAGLTVVGFWSFLVPWRALKQPAIAAIFVGCVGVGVGGAYLARDVIPPVPLMVAEGAVGPKVLDDGRLAMHVTQLHTDEITSMHAVTDVVSPAGVGDRLYHVWRKDDLVVQTITGDAMRREKKDGLIRLRSKLPAQNIPEEPSARAGEWSVDVMTGDGQLVGRARFTVVE